VRALVVLAQPPTLEGNAPGRCAAALLRGLAANGIDVEAVAARQFFAGEDTVPPDLEVEVLDVADDARGARSQLRRLYRPRSSLLGPFSERVRERAWDFDVVHLEETETAWCDLGVERPSSLHMHFRVLRDRPVPAPWRHEFRFLAEFAAAELFAARRHRFLVANSDRVAASLRRLNRKAEVVVAPLALGPEQYAPAELDGPPAAGLIGSGDWPPTANAIARLVDRVWPAVQREVPDARLTIAGRKTATLAPKPTAGSIEFVGEVDSAATFLAGLSVLLYPVERGSGMKVKVLEALASGVPVVTTEEGAEGIAPTDGIVVVPDDDGLASAAADLLRDPTERKERGRAGRDTFLARYTPKAATAPLASFFRRMAENR
jgi:glycosyltransferase involved in cell wall biosynthesis